MMVEHDFFHEDILLCIKMSVVKDCYGYILSMDLFCVHDRLARTWSLLVPETI